MQFPGYKLTRADRPDGRGYGGVAVLSRADFNVKRLQSVCTCSICRLETLWMSVTCKRGRKFVLCAVYRPPRHAANHLAADFNCLDVQYQRILLMTSDPILIAGDLNCNMLGADSDLARGKLQEF